MDKVALDHELFEWKQKRLEEGKFPCKCGHFENSHVKRVCIACHGEDEKNNDPTEHWQGSCWHNFEQMDNLTLIEWIAANKELK